MRYQFKLDGAKATQSLAQACIVALVTGFLTSTSGDPAAATAAAATTATAAAAGATFGDSVIKAVADAAGSALKVTEREDSVQERLAQAVKDSLERAFDSFEGDSTIIPPVTMRVREAVMSAATSGSKTIASDDDGVAYLHALIKHACEVCHDGSLLDDAVRGRLVGAFFVYLGEKMFKDDLLSRMLLMRTIGSLSQRDLGMSAGIDALQEDVTLLLEQQRLLADGGLRLADDTELLSRMGSVMREVLDERAALDGAHAPSPDASDLLTHCRDRLGKQRDNHPSFRLMRDGFSGAILPKGTGDAGPAPIPNRGRLVRPDGGEPMPFRDFVRESWGSEGQEHLLVTGRGGMGKTVAMLTFATEEGFLKEGVPVAYVPLHDLSYYSEKGPRCIDRYLEDNFSQEDRDAIRRLSNEPWDGGPNVLLLLDGYNEVPPNRRAGVDRGIRAWAERAGTQLVTTSRVPCLAALSNVRRLELLPLSAEEARSYLAWRGKEAPTDGDARLWEVLVTPLMLKIFADVGDLPGGLGASYLRLMESDSAGHLMWNYLQRELWRVVDHNGDDEDDRDDHKQAERAAAVLLTMPYVCWRMESAHEFRVGKDRLRGYVRDACARWRDEKSRPEGFSDVEGSLDSFVGDMAERQFVSSQLTILANETGLLAWNGDGYSLLHQSLRDGFAAIHLKNAMEAPYVELPGEFKQSISEYVKDFLADVCEDGALGALWETNRATLPTDATATHNLLRVIHRRRDGDLAALDWSGMDLRGYSLFPYRNEAKLEVSTRPERFAGTRMDRACFMRQGHSERVLSVCFSPDGKMLASGSMDGEVRFWDAVAMRQVLPTFDCDGLYVTSMRFSPDNRLIAVGTRVGTAYLLSASSGRPLGEPIQVWSDINSNWFSMGGVLLAFGSDDEKIQLIRSDINSVCFSPDGALLAFGSDDGGVVLWDVGKGSPASHVLEADSPVHSVCFSPDGRLLAGGSEDGVVRLWDVGTGALSEPSLEADAPVHSVCFSPDGSRIAVGYDSSMRVWDTRTRSFVHTPLEVTSQTCDVCYTNDGSLFAIANDDGVVRLWDTTGCGAGSASIEIGTWVHCACLSPDGSYVACGYGDDGVRILATATAGVVGSSEGDARYWSGSLSVSPDGSRIAVRTADGMLRLWSPQTGSMTSRPIEVGNHARSHCFSPDGLTVAVAWDPFVGLWDARTGLPAAPPLEGCRAIRSVLFSPDGSLLAAVFSGSFIEPDVDCGICVWNTRTSEKLVGPMVIQPQDLFWRDGVFPCFSPDSSRLAIGHDHGVRVLDSTTGTVIVELLGRPEKASHCCFSPDGSLLAAVYDNSVCIWNVETGGLATSVDAHGVRVRFARFSPDGTELAVGHKKGVIILNLVSGDVTGLALEPEAVYDSAAYLKDGTLIVTGIDVGELRVWYLTTGEVRCARPKDSERIASFELSENGELLVAMGYDGTVSLWRTRDLLDDIPETGPMRTLETLYGIDVFGLDFSLASIEDGHDREVLRQNGAKVKPPRGITDHSANRTA